MLIKEVDSLF